MNKPHNNGQQKPKPRIDAVLPVQQPANDTPSLREIPIYRHCPVCWEGNGGYGDCYSTQGRTRYYKCKQTTKPGGVGPCGHTWTATVTLEAVKIEHRRVIIDGQR